MSEETTQANGTAAEGLREVPSDLREYKKFVAEGGHEHNAKIRGREEAEKAARDAGLQLASGDEQHKPHKNGFQARINRLQRKIGERDQRIADLEKRASAQPAAEAPAKPDAAEPAPKAEAKTPPRPEEKDFKTYSEFVEALTEWKTDRKLEERETKRAENKQQSEAEKRGQEIMTAHNARVDEAKTRYEDWDKAFKGLDDNSFSDPMVVYIFESDKGPDITYYLATHRKELARIRELSPLRQAAALGRIEDQLTEEQPDEGEENEGEGEPKPAKPAPAKPAKPVKPADDEEQEDESDEEEEKPARRARSTHSKAPAPAKPLGGRGAADDAMPDPTDFVAYEKWAKRQQAKAKAR